jgi:hypothetical protein
MEEFNTVINDAIQTSLVNNILNIYRQSIRTTRNPNRLSELTSILNNTNISSRYYNNPPQGGYIVNEEHEYVFPDNDDLSSLIFLDITTRFASPGSDGCDRYKKYRNKKIKDIGKYKKVKEADSLTNEVCSICIEKFCCGEYQRTLHCNHVFHKKCIDKWFKKDKNDCPMCRAVIIDYQE